MILYLVSSFLKTSISLTWSWLLTEILELVAGNFNILANILSMSVFLIGTAMRGTRRPYLSVGDCRYAVI